MKHDIKLARMLLIDTCGDGAGIATSLGDQVVATAALSRTAASAEILDAIHPLLMKAGCALADLDAIAVVSGPGSFTGVRVGMSVAKGLVEALQVKMLTLSRLEMLAVAANIRNGWALLDAGRSGLYAMHVKDGVYGPERFLDLDALQATIIDGDVAVTEERVAVLLQARAAELRVVLRPLNVDDALTLSLGALRSNANAMALADANYLLHENDIYKAKSID